ncbi:MAG: methionyl-tRNA formyltransferase [Acidimicrobiales bacterium]|jgi:methionyl-tRNA formyltransferase|nr:methionyl-tRNA formyltransferase [Acidimicrobiales bacterium]MDP6298656.1 methionyl-tRNA formyltransferase [Acidimicrobiales bacterium]HJM28864.1 methionyl-tRNA formyltransferase [Acidimicrobiales bacterium]HJM97254.1 methionyl-tRNA formyltransferase [Acidimicrobiales bacterium]
MTLLDIPERVQKVVYLGTPEIAVSPLREIYNNGIEITLVVTGEDKRRGRGGTKTPTPVKVEAQKLGIPVSHRLEDIESVKAELGVVVAYGKLIPEETLQVLPMVNIHFSLLPRWRGAAPLERAILSGDRYTGVCIMQVDKELDAGGIFRMKEVPILEEDSLGELKEKLSAEGNKLLLDCFNKGFGEPVPQKGEATYAKKITADDFRLDWNKSAEQIHRIVRLGKGWTTIKGKRLRILEIENSYDENLNPGEIKGTKVGTGEGTIELLTVKPSGKEAMDARSWANGLRLDSRGQLGE